MPTWLKYVLSTLSGFAATAGTVYASGGNNKTALVGGALGAISSLGSLTASAPKDEKRLN